MITVKTKDALIKAIADKALSILLPDLGRDILVKIAWARLPADTYGICQAYLDCKNEYRVLLSPTIKGIHMVEVLLHELAHVKQYATGELKASNRYWIWQGKRYSVKRDGEPWEWAADAWAEELLELVFQK